MRKKILLCLTLFLSVVTTSKAQIAVAYYPIQSEFSISSNTEKLLWGDLMVLTNTFFGGVTFEPRMMINVKRTNSVNYYTGLGINLNFFNSISNISIINGYTLAVGTRIKPLKNHKNFQVIFELSPYINKSFDGGLFRTRLGIAYQFNKKI